MSYHRPFGRPPGQHAPPFGLRNSMPMPGQFFNPMVPPRPLIPGFGGPPHPGLRLPPMPRHSMPPRPRPPPVLLPPKTTVFVGNIAEDIGTELIQQLCQECGPVASFRRMQSANGKLQAFAFCEYAHPDHTRRALRLLNGFFLGGKALNLKIEEKVREQISLYMNSVRVDSGLPPLIIPEGAELPSTEEEKNKDAAVIIKIKENVAKVNPDFLIIPEPEPEPVKETKKRRSSSSSSSASSSAHGHSSDSEDDFRRLKNGRPSDSKQTSSSYARRSDSRPLTPDRGTKSREASERPSSKRSLKRDHTGTPRSPKPTKSERQSEAERDQAYEKRLRKWEEKELAFARDHEAEREKQRKRQKQREREARKLKIFHEDYDDDVDDAKYYRGDSLVQRRKAYDEQVEKDRIDREAEQAQLDAIRNEILNTAPQTGQAEVEAEARKRIDEAKTSHRGIDSIKLPFSPRGVTPEGTPPPDECPAIFKNVPTSSNSGWATLDPISTPTAPPLIGTKISMNAPVVNTNGVFGEDPDDDEDEKAKKKMRPLEITQKERLASLTTEERKRRIRDLIDTIPKNPDQIFAFPLRWDLLDDALIEARIRPWVMKKVLQYIGEDEPALVKFVCDCVRNKADPKKLVLDLSMVFDDEAESFITKMWRLMIYETEARHTGLSSSLPAVPSKTPSAHPKPDEPSSSIDTTKTATPV
uniref:PWI domain-containing protein n=1 Tax=Panagrellus redivivus TaxID=6233 RepID=A0A7E4W4I4_PANRE